jgi:hypothetical protein
MTASHTHHPKKRISAYESSLVYCGEHMRNSFFWEWKKRTRSCVVLLSWMEHTQKGHWKSKCFLPNSDFAQILWSSDFRGSTRSTGSSDSPWMLLCVCAYPEKCSQSWRDPQQQQQQQEQQQKGNDRHNRATPSLSFIIIIIITIMLLIVSHCTYPRIHVSTTTPKTLQRKQNRAASSPTIITIIHQHDHDHISFTYPQWRQVCEGLRRMKS